MEVIEAIFQRRAVRAYTDAPVPEYLVTELIRAATWAPSAVNQQPWAFAVVQGRKRLEGYSERAKRHLLEILPQSLELHQRFAALTDPAYNVFHSAGTLIVIYSRPGPYSPQEDCCLAAENLMLAAEGMGLGTCPIGFVRPWLNLREIKEELDVPTDYAAVMPIVVGWPAGASKPGARNEPQILSWRGELKS